MSRYSDELDGWPHVEKSSVTSKTAQKGRPPHIKTYTIEFVDGVYHTRRSRQIPGRIAV